MGSINKDMKVMLQGETKEMFLSLMKSKTHSHRQWAFSAPSFSTSVQLLMQFSPQSMGFQTVAVHRNRKMKYHITTGLHTCSLLEMVLMQQKLWSL